MDETRSLSPWSSAYRRREDAYVARWEGRLTGENARLYFRLLSWMVAAFVISVVGGVPLGVTAANRSLHFAVIDVWLFALTLAILFIVIRVSAWNRRFLRQVKALYGLEGIRTTPLTVQVMWREDRFDAWVDHNGGKRRQ